MTLHGLNTVEILRLDIAALAFTGLAMEGNTALAPVLFPVRVLEDRLARFTTKLCVVQRLDDKAVYGLAKAEVLAAVRTRALLLLPRGDA